MIILNPRTYTVLNLGDRGVAWTFDDAGQPQLFDADAVATDYEEVSISANIQPYLGRKAMMDGGIETVNRIKGYVGADSAGVFPYLDVADNAAGARGSLVSFCGEIYEVVLTKAWTLGLLPHLYFEAELLSRDLTNGGGSSAGVEW